MMATDSPAGFRPAQKNARVLLWLCILALFAGCLLLRMPFIANPLIGEEGSFARLVIGSSTVASKIPRGFPEMLAGRIDGTEIFGFFQRNIIIYLVLDYPARWAGNLLWPAGGTFDSVTVSARATFLLMFCTGAWVVGWAVARFAGGRGLLTALAGFALAAYTLTAPLMVGVSIQPQIDGSVGMLFMGLCGFLLLKGGTSPQAGGYYLAAGLIAGLGRPEWLIAMTGAAVVVAVASILFPDRVINGADAGPRTRWRAVLPVVLFAAGLAIGTVVSIVVSPKDFFAGFSVLTRVSATTGGDLATIVQFRQFLLPLGVLSGAAMLMALIAFLNKKADGRTSLTGGQAIALVGGVAIIVGFALSGWSSDGFPRYFAPAMLLVAIGAISLLSDPLPRWPAAIRGVVLILGCAYGLYFNASSLLDSYRRQVSISSYHGYPLELARKRMTASAEISQSQHRVVLEFSSLGLYFPKAEFVSTDWGVQGAKDLIKSVAPGREDQLYQPK